LVRLVRQATNNGSDTGYNPQNQFAISDYDGVASFTNWTNIAGMNSNGGTVLFVNRCKSNTSGTHTGGALANGDKVGRIVFNASDGTAFRTAASIEAAMDNVTGASDVPGRLVFSTTADGASSPTERMRITSSGRLRSFGSDNIAFELATSSAAGTTNLLFSGNYGASGIGGGTECIRIYSNGNVQNTNNSYGAISDVKLKENVVDANSQWDDLKVLQVRNYNFRKKASDSHPNRSCRPRSRTRFPWPRQRIPRPRRRRQRPWHRHQERQLLGALHEGSQGAAGSDGADRNP
jgi:hypothetical protein